MRRTRAHPPGRQPALPESWSPATRSVTALAVPAGRDAGEAPGRQAADVPEPRPGPRLPQPAAAGRGGAAASGPRVTPETHYGADGKPPQRPRDDPKARARCPPPRRHLQARRPHDPPAQAHRPITVRLRRIDSRFSFYHEPQLCPRAFTSPHHRCSSAHGPPPEHTHACTHTCTRTRARTHTHTHTCAS